MTTEKTELDTTIHESLQIALRHINQARSALRAAPKRLRDELNAIRDEVEGFDLSLIDELKEAVEDEGDWCRDCEYCERDPGTRWVEASRDCRMPAAGGCPGVIDVLGMV